jgi:NADPH:quinone reductase
MRALVLGGMTQPQGLPDALQIATLPDPVAGPGEVRVRVEAGALNPTDYQRAQYGVAEWTWPAILGLDVVGIVDQVGAGVAGLEEGDRVAYVGDIRRPGAFAEKTVTEADVVAKVPDGLDVVAAAALPSAGCTAYQAVARRLSIGPGHTVLVTGGAGGVGGFAVQLAAARGARVLTTEHPDNLERVRALGAECLVDFRGDVVEQVRELTDGRGVDAVVDTIGSESATTNLGLLAFGGGLVAIAGRPDLSVLPPFRLATSLHEIALGAAYFVDDPRPRRDLGAMMEELMALSESGRLDPMVERVIELPEVAGALVELAGRRVRGKIVHRFV